MCHSYCSDAGLGWFGKNITNSPIDTFKDNQNAKRASYLHILCSNAIYFGKLIYVSTSMHVTCQTSWQYGEWLPGWFLTNMGTVKVYCTTLTNQPQYHAIQIRYCYNVEIRFHIWAEPVQIDWNWAEPSHNAQFHVVPHVAPNLKLHLC